MMPSLPRRRRQQQQQQWIVLVTTQWCLLLLTALLSGWCMQPGEAIHFTKTTTTTATTPPPPAHRLFQSRCMTKQSDTDNKSDPSLLQEQVNLHVALTVRGGSSIKNMGANDDDDDNDNAGGLIVTKVRHLIRSLIHATKGTPFQAFVKGVFGTVESVTGLKLLPSSSSSSSSSSKKKKKTKKLLSTKNNKETTTKTTPSSSSSSKSSKTSTSSSKKKGTRSTTAKKNTKAASAWTHQEIKSTSPNYRIQRELKAFLADPPPNLSVKVGKNLRVWIITMRGTALYEGETFKLRIAFPAQYPQVPPSVYFLPPHIPLHEHVYTNGDICLSLLGKDWRPTMTAQSIAVSIQSILASAQSKALPMDNARHAQNRPGQYQKDWVYHDDNC